VSFRRSGRLAAITLALTGALAGSAAAAAPLEAAPVAHGSVINGYQPHPSQWPWMVALTSKGAGPDVLARQYCGGTLIAPALVLTAAHCVVEQGKVTAPAAMQVVVGRRNLDRDPGEIIDVTAITPHPQYAKEGTNSYDLALIDLARPSAATPAAFVDPTVVVPEGTRATVMGWGRTGPRKVDPKSADLLAADLPLWTGERCNVAYGRSLHVASAVCAGYMDGRIDSCPGDSGGPLMVRDSAGAWRLIGVVSYGPDCGTAKIPGVYAWVNALKARTFLATRLPGISTAAPPSSRSTPRNLRVSGKLRHGRRVTVRYRLDEPATVQFGVFRRREEQLIQVGRAIRRRSAAGVNRFRLGRSTVGRRLRSGRYVLIAAAADATGAPTALRYARLRVAR
jgi:trypsin